ncbi:hypothetical protein Acr_22g0001330 [Actinidia rufa]|uniref:CCHC-type domain-containing protein n=1 Tax=Actinidia rufa TaxID=165716 RepID=A0A7J0GIY5_9ERIC|nr:hypothetical protein Acr_22g0001330 [Actinidia rufa]
MELQHQTASENRVRTRPHAPFEDRRVRSVSATRPGRSHALRRARGRTHAPARARRVQPRASTRREEATRAAKRQGVVARAHTRCPRARGGQLAAHAEPHQRLARGCTVRCFYCDQEGHIKRDCPKYKAQDQSSDTAATAVMAVDESEVLLAASDDGNFDASGGILRVSKENKEMLWGKKTGGLYRLEGSVQTGGATVRHGSSGISEKSGQGKQPLHRGTQSKRRVQDVHREAQKKETKSILRSCTAKGAATPKRVSFALDLISGGVLSSCAHKGGEMEPRQLAK